MVMNGLKNKTYFCIRHDHVTGISLSLLSDLVQAAISLLHNVNHDRGIRTRF